MARKNPFASVMDDGFQEEHRPVLDYTIKGASKSILNSIDEMAARADKLLEGETVVELEPGLIDASFVKDRLDDDPDEYEALLAAIRERGQDSPILVRPHPKVMGRYMVVFGHRRVNVAKALGRKVRAVVKDIEDRAHVVAQGQENSARANLSFIEKALFASSLARLQYDNDNATVLAALSIDKATLSKMLSVTNIPSDIFKAIGAAKTIGRDRWYELKILLEKPSNLDKALAFIDQGDFRAWTSDDRFNALFNHLKSAKKVAKAIAPRNIRKWAPEDKAVAVDMTTDGRNFTLALKARDAVGFGEFISDSLADLYEAYRSRKNADQGD